jgi:hypothetical protein
MSIAIENLKTAQQRGMAVVRRLVDFHIWQKLYGRQV